MHKAEEEMKINFQRGTSTKKLRVVGGATDSTHHSFDEEEKVQFVLHINQELANVVLFRERLPINTEGDALFKEARDGLLFAKLIQLTSPELVDERVLNKKENLNKFEMAENNSLVINSAKALGCTIVNIDTNDLMEERKHLVLGLLWQVIKKGLLSRINLKHHPELSRLLTQQESLESFLRSAPDEILLRWFNYQLAKGGCQRQIKNLSSDLKDSICYIHLLKQLAPEKCSLSPLSIQNLEQRAEEVLKAADRMGCRKYLTTKAILEGNPRLNLAFVANLFNLFPGLEALTQNETKKIDETLFSFEKDRELRVFTLWLNCITEGAITSLLEDLKDGLVLLKALDTVSQGLVNWKLVNKERPLNRFKAIENCNYVTKLCKETGMSLVGVQGADITDGVIVLTLAVVWQIMKLHVFRILQKVANNERLPKDKDLLDWANNLLQKGGKTSSITSFRDPGLKSSFFFLEMLDCISPGIVDYSLIETGGEEECLKSNALYATSLARKAGAVLFLLPEDVVEGNQKMVLTFIASLLELHSRIMV